MKLPPIIPASQKLKDRMKRLADQPAPTLEQAKQQIAASIRQMEEFWKRKK